MEPAVVEELDGEADDLVVGDDPLVLVGHLAAVLVGAVGSCRDAQTLKASSSPFKFRKQVFIFFLFNLVF